EESIRKSKLDDCEKDMALYISRLLSVAPDDSAYDGILKALATDSSVSTNIKKYFGYSGSITSFGDPRLPVFVNNRVVLVSMDNNISESFNASTKRAHQNSFKRFNSVGE
ncbi:hypothetical protein Pmar_PMAR024195, partial [Perkinsus marinus ATCC 50983]